MHECARFKQRIERSSRSKNNGPSDTRHRALSSSPGPSRQIQQRLNCQQDDIKEKNSEQHAQTKQALKELFQNAVVVGNCDGIHLQGLASRVHKVEVGIADVDEKVNKNLQAECAAIVNIRFPNGTTQRKKRDKSLGAHPGSV
jgi:hypothetical protein